MFYSSSMFLVFLSIGDGAYTVLNGGPWVIFVIPGCFEWRWLRMICVRLIFSEVGYLVLGITMGGWLCIRWLDLVIMFLLERRSCKEGCFYFLCCFVLFRCKLWLGCPESKHVCLSILEVCIGQGSRFLWYYFRMYGVKSDCSCSFSG